MIEINLRPGTRKQKRSQSPGFDFGAFFANIAAKIRDPFLIAAVVSVVLSVIAVGGLWFYQNRQSTTLTEHQAKATQDSTRYSAVIAERRGAEAQRDSVIAQINVIKAIDGSRYVWPHILDEVDRALPPLTWLKSLAQISAVSGLSPEVQAGLEAGNGKPKTKIEAKMDSDAVAAAQLTWRVIGQTVDIQALTRFITQLDASPWIESVVLVKSDNTVVQPGSKEVIEFTLDMKLQKADSSVIKRVPLSVAVK
jgi:Tfp pilus assembly protein PilN